MTMLSDFYKFYNTADATVLPEHLKAGETAFGPDGKVVGTWVPLPVDALGGYKLLYPFPTGVAGSYDPVLSDCVIAESGISISEPTPATLDANGYLYGSTSYGFYLMVSGMSARGSGPRIIRTMALISSGVASATGPSIVHNWTDSNNYWYTGFAWDGGSTFRLSIREVNVGVNTERAFITFGVVGLPCLVNLEVWDAGDSIAASASAWETDTTGDFVGGMCNYYSVNRFNKAVTTFGLRHNENPGSLVKFQNISVIDIP